MNLKKTLLAAAVAFVGFGAQAADPNGKADVFKYELDGKIIYKIDVKDSITGKELNSGYYTASKDANGKDVFKVYQGSTTGANLISGGQFATSYVADEGSSTEVTTEIGSTTNDYWGSETKINGVAGIVEFDLNGQLVLQNGQIESKLDGGYKDGGEALKPTVLIKDVEVGKLSKKDRDFNVVAGTYGTLATEGSSVSALTGNGLTVVDAPKGSTVNLATGTVTQEINTAGTKVNTNELRAYKNAQGEKVYEIAGKYYSVSAQNNLKAYAGSTDQLVQYAAGVAETYEAGSKSIQTNTGFVSNQNVTYGESSTKQTNASSIQVGSTDPNFVQDGGNTYTLGEGGQKVTSSKNVVTGIIAVDEKTGSKTYGLQATNVVDNKVTAQTTVTAEGIRTTGDITFVDAITQQETSVKGYLDNTVNRLNSRVNDIKETAYSGVAIALAAQQQVPNIGAGQVAVFGGAGHYEGETAGALGLVGVLADGRTSLSGALGVGGSGDIGGRVGVAYVFGGK